MQGRFGELIELTRDAAARFPAMVVFRTALAAALAEAGRADEARAELERLAAGDLAAVPRDPAWSFSLATLALACYHLGEAETAVKLHGLLEPYADRNIVTGRVGAICLGRRPTSWDCSTSPAVSPSRPCAAFGTRPRSPTACRAGRWWP